MNGIILDKNLIAVKSSEAIKLAEGEEFKVVINKVIYLCKVESKRAVIERGFRFMRIRLVCLSHPEIKVTEYSNI